MHISRRHLQLAVREDLHGKARVDKGEALRHVLHHSLTGHLYVPAQGAERSIRHNCHDAGLDSWASTCGECRFYAQRDGKPQPQELYCSVLYRCNLQGTVHAYN